MAGSSKTRRSADTVSWYTALNSGERCDILRILMPVPPTSKSSAWMHRITASGIGAGPGEKLASGIDESNGRVAPVSAGCGSIATPSTLSEVLGGEGVSTHTVETVSTSLAPPHPLWDASGSFSYDARRSRRFCSAHSRWLSRSRDAHLGG